MSINWISIVIATLIPTAVGFVWYHKAVFGKAWMSSIGMTDEKFKEANMGLTYGLSIVMSFILAFFLLNFNNGAGQDTPEFDTFAHGAHHGIFMAVIVVMPVLISKGLFEQASWKSTWINIGYWAVSFALMGGILDVMNHWECVNPCP